jgi:hypothetical protein
MQFESECPNWLLLFQAPLLCSRWRFLAPRLRNQQNRVRTELLFCWRIRTSSRHRLRRSSLQLLLRKLWKTQPVCAKINL